MHLSKYPPLFLTHISAGFPSPAEDEIDQTLDLNEFLVKRPAATFFVRVQGDSMQGAGIFAGDILIIDRSLAAQEGNVILAILNGEFTVKKWSFQKQKRFLLAENPLYPPIEVSIEDDFQIWGVVTYVIHRL